MEIRKNMKEGPHSNYDQSRLEEAQDRTKKRNRARRWDAILVGIVYSIAFVLLLTKVSQITPCEAIGYLNIDTMTCSLIDNANTIEGQIARQHGLGFDIVFEFELLVLELSDKIMDRVQGSLDNMGLI
jgi:hypothetical protein